MNVHAVITDTTGTAYITADRRHHLFELCAWVGMDRRAIRWNADLRCYVLTVRTDTDKQAVRQFLKINGKGGDSRAPNSIRMRQADDRTPRQ